jgi:predicted ATPase
MRVALARHDEIATSQIERFRGVVVKNRGEGDSLFAVFPVAADAVAAACALQTALQKESWPDSLSILVRMAVHTGEAEFRDGDYFGPSVNRCARLRAIGHGGQVLLSQSTQLLVQQSLPAGASLRDMGERRLKDLIRPENVFQLLAPDLPSDFPPLRSLDARAHNLPVQATSFIGREREMLAVKERIKSARLVTLTGSGGCGKTRLTLQVAADLIDDYADGVWLVELAPLSDPAHVSRAVAHALAIREMHTEPILETLLKQLREKNLLLLLDNCEHLVESCALLCERLLASCSGVRIIATSREALRIPGEALFDVPSLSIPDPAHDTAPEQLAMFESVSLFADRAIHVQPDFKITKENAPALASVCQRLDGIPLAIELAAARVRSLSVEEVNERLDHRFSLLVGGSRLALPRQQTLRSLVDWSYDLLNEHERALLCRLSVFSGGWTLEAAEEVCVGEPLEGWEILELLTSLADKSLVVTEQKAGSTRYRLLETVRQYAKDRLTEQDESARWRDRHLAYFADLGFEAEPHLAGGEQQEWLERLNLEHDNLRAAFDWSREPDGKLGADGHPRSHTNLELGLKLAGAIWRFWYVRGYFAEGRERIAGLLAAANPSENPEAYASALKGAGVLAYCQGEYPESRALFEEGLALYRSVGDAPGVATLLNNLGNVAYDEGDFASARSLFEDSLAMRREIGEQRGIAASLNNLGNVANEQGDYEAARVLFEESLAIKKQLGDQWGIAYSVSNLGNVAYNLEDYASARAFFEESLELRNELDDRAGIAISLNNLGNVELIQGNYIAARSLFQQSLSIKTELVDRWGICFSFEGIAATDAVLGQEVFAARLWGATECLREEVGAPLPPNDRQRYEHFISIARASLADDAAFDAAWAEGRAMTLDDAIALAQRATTE